MARYRNGRRAKSESGWNRRLLTARRERAAERAESNEASRPRLRAKGGSGAYTEPGQPWTDDREGGA